MQAVEFRPDAVACGRADLVAGAAFVERAVIAITSVIQASLVIVITLSCAPAGAAVR